MPTFTHVVHDDGTIHGAGSGEENAWADFRRVMKEARIDPASMEGIECHECTAAISASVETGGPVGWALVDGVVMTRAESRDPEVTGRQGGKAKTTRKAASSAANGARGGRPEYHTILTNGYTVQNGDDGRATGGVTFVEIAKTTKGLRVRSTDSNGRFVSSGNSTPCTEARARQLIEQAKGRADNDERQGNRAAAKIELEHLAKVVAALGL